ncbi:hypothetical protein [Pseudidiomarina donghaiensis]|uniref:Uncharacterized protein n=1 Tax=Pseudidiomarina donghaiensis TaxID=519452 RepID=A0A432XKV2_9GAMM|nr:hypothetical protein [Pseudidiomarina donghaiensis]RUO49332.1 hypothetical protein CWE24_02165 [Pseudidiomarina donghaiensis]SFV21010.1 hypothetical protein SAMN04488139_0568 [Pseudidiomarina donghaiensis]
MKKLLPFLFLTPFAALAQSVPVVEDVVKAVGPYEISSLQAQNSVIHLYLPADSVGVVGITGGDTFVSAVENTSRFDLKISEDDKSVFLKNSMAVGSATTFALTTACGVSVSVYMHTVKIDDPEKKVAPKLSLTSSSCN